MENSCIHETMKIEKAGISEIDLIMKWRMETLEAVFGIDFSDYPEDPSLGQRLEEANRAYFLQHLEDDSCIFCFGKIKDQIASCGAIISYQELPSPDYPSGRCAYLMNIYTAPSFRHQTFGRQIVRWLIEQAQKQGAQKIYLDTSEAGRPLYQAAGFQDMTDYMVFESRNMHEK